MSLIEVRFTPLSVSHSKTEYHRKRAQKVRSFVDSASHWGAYFRSHRWRPSRVQLEASSEFCSARRRARSPWTGLIAPAHASPVVKRTNAQTDWQDCWEENLRQTCRQTVVLRRTFSVYQQIESLQFDFVARPLALHRDVSVFTSAVNFSQVRQDLLQCTLNEASSWEDLSSSHDSV